MTRAEAFAYLAEHGPRIAEALGVITDRSHVEHPLGVLEAERLRAERQAGGDPSGEGTAQSVASPALASGDGDGVGRTAPSSPAFRVGDRVAHKRHRDTVGTIVRAYAYTHSNRSRGWYVQFPQGTLMARVTFVWEVDLVRADG